MSQRVKIIGAGLAGSEAAWQCARRGVAVELFEMRPVRSTAAHQTGEFAELVCSNSLKSDTENTAPWLLKEESNVVFIIFSQLQSEKITTGFLPPNSSESFLNMGAATLAIFLPVAVPPVKEIALMSG